MAEKLKNSYRVRKLANDLGLTPGDDPVAAVLEYCRRKVRRVVREFKCATLPQLLNTLAAHLDTRFVEIHSDSDLIRITKDYLAQGERVFATLENDLGPNVFAITFKLTNKKRWQRKYVSLIDCRGEKKWRSYYSKWHELAHLLTLTDQMRLAFTRTHCQADDAKDPEEALMEVIAGTFGFWDEMIGRSARGEISFNSIEELRAKHFPEASKQASVIGIVRAWDSPCVLISATLGLRQNERRSLRQGAFDFAEKPSPELRATKVTANDAAREAGLVIFPNMRIPKKSVIYRVFSEGLDQDEATENLSSWSTREGNRLAPQVVLIKARRTFNGVEALITPISVQ